MSSQYAKGVSLVELLVSLSLGLILTTGAIQAFIHLKNLTRYQQGLTRIQENIQAASQILGPVIRSSGKFGCVRLTETLSTKVWDEANIGLYGLGQGQSLVGTNKDVLVKNSLVRQSVLRRMESNSDVLWVRMAEDIYPVTKTIEPFAKQISVIGSPRFWKDDLLFIGDCQSIHFFLLRKDSVKLPKTNQTMLSISSHHGMTKFSKVYDSPAVVGKVGSILYYIGQTTRKNAQGEPVYALYKTDLNGRTAELIEGVDAMQLTFGLLEKGKIVYVPFKAIQDGSQVVSVQVGLRFNSIEPATVQGKVMQKWWSHEWARRSARLA